MNAEDAAQQLLQNKNFIELFQRALGSSGDDAASSDLLKSMPKEGDPKREEWLRNLQSRLQEETMKEARKDLEQVHSDEHGQWMFVLPNPGFCIKTNTAGGGKVFINVCQHARVGEPMPMESEGVADAGQKKETEMRFRVPISCGQARPDQDKSGKPCKVYDVIVNPATIRRCSEDHEFRRFVAALCMQWIKQKSEPTLNADEFRHLNFKCKGKLEPQRIRLSTQAKAPNAMGDEIRLPSSADEATAPSQLTGTQGNGKLVEEVVPPEEEVQPANAAQADVSASLSPQVAPTPAVKSVVADGTYNWTTHRRPATNPYFKENVPAYFRVTLFLPGIQTIREVEVRIGHRQVDCFYVDDIADADDEEVGAAAVARGCKAVGASPFLSATLDYPVSDEVEDAKYVRKSSLLKLTLKVQLPDETQTPVTRPERDVTEIEREEQERARAAQEKLWEATKVQRERQQEEEAAVMAERRSYVDNLAAVQAGDIPPVIREEVDQMPRDQLPAMLLRLEGRIRKGDSIDVLLEKLPEDMVEALIDYIRDKLSLQPRQRNADGKGSLKATAKSSASSSSAATAAGAQAKAKRDANRTASLKEEATSSPLPSERAEESPVQEFNAMKQSETLFGVAFHNRYLFALD